MFCDAVYITDPGKPVINPALCYTGFGYSVIYTIKTFAPALVLDFYSKIMPDAMEWKWDFGDGTTSTETNPTHIFNFPVGINPAADPNPFRKVCLTVKNKSGCVANYCESINIYMNTTKPVEPVVRCQALFKYARITDYISIPELVPYKLTDVSTGNVKKRTWMFEDGKTRTEAEPVVYFDIMKPTQKVCLTVYTDSCSSTWCDVVYVSGVKTTTTTTGNAGAGGYTMRYKSGFPIQMSSCAGYASAQVYLKDSAIKATNYKWSTGAEGQDVKGLCPTQVYSVKALTPDGTIVSGSFRLNSDGTVTEVPVNWYMTGTSGNYQVKYSLTAENYTVEWRLCDGTIIKSDSIPLNSINCNSKTSNLILKDAMGNVIYSENISGTSLPTFIEPLETGGLVKFFPNPVSDMLYLKYSGDPVVEIQAEIRDLNGKILSLRKVENVYAGQLVGLDVTTLPEGLYFCRVLAGTQILGVEKFSKF